MNNKIDNIFVLIIVLFTQLAQVNKAVHGSGGSSLIIIRQLSDHIWELQEPISTESIDKTTHHGLVGCDRIGQIF